MNARVLVCSALVVASACQAATSGPPSSETVRKPKVVTAHADTVDYEHDLRLPGTLEGFEHAELFAQVTGYLQEVSVDIGDAVEAGDIIAKISVPQMRSDLERAVAELEVARATLTRRTEEQQLAALEHERREGLRSSERAAIAQTDVDAAAAGEGIAQADVARAQAQTATARAEIARLKTLERFAAVRAPFSGRVTHRILHPGALVRAGTSPGAEPIIELTRVNPLRLVIMVPESLVAHVGPGHEVTVTFDAANNKGFTAKIARVAEALDPRTRSMRAEIDVLNTSGAYKPGMFANVRVVATAFKGLKSLPSASVRGSGDERYVLIVRDAIVHAQSVTVVFDDGKQALISKGIEATDDVIVAGSPLAEAGVSVDVVEASS